MRGFWQKIIEGILVNVIGAAIKIVITAFITVLSIQAIIQSATGNTGIPVDLVIYSVAIIIIVFALKLCFGNQYAHFRWDIIHNHNKYILTFKDRENAEYTKTIGFTPLREGIEALTEGEYNWTGDNSIPEIVEKDDFYLEFLNNSMPRTYAVNAKNTLVPYKKHDYTLYIKLEDASQKMIPIHYVFIKRPTKKITLELIVPNEVQVRNVRKKAWTKFGEKSIFVDKMAIPIVDGGHNVNYKKYEYVVRRPKIFCEYAITWEWD